ncbi:MAG: Citrate (pro-3S)-lyase [candidate division NC10 bacterium]|nr:Citrate (pro-3S)-lyase [candidate division NC10 bacterium]
MTTHGVRHLRRTFLYVPGSEERKLVKAQTLGADAVILDLEDSVAPERKADARERISGLLRGTPNPAVEWLIRLNGVTSPHFEADLACAIAAKPDGLVIAKVDDPATLQEVDRRLDAAERNAGRPAGSLKLFAMIESARAVLNAYAIAGATSRLQGLILGHVDLLRDLGLTPGPAGQGTVHHARCQLVLAARAARVDAVDAIYLNIQDHDSLRDESLQAARLGFVGKQVIHPGQIPIVHAAFTPSAERVQRAERILGFWQKAQAEGKGVVAMDGMLLEPPVIAMEELVLERARQAR